MSNGFCYDRYYGKLKNWCISDYHTCINYSNCMIEFFWTTKKLSQFLCGKVWSEFVCSLFILSYVVEMIWNNCLIIFPLRYETEGITTFRGKLYRETNRAQTSNWLHISYNINVMDLGVYTFPPSMNLEIILLMLERVDVNFLLNIKGGQSDSFTKKYQYQTVCFTFKILD